jgi:hypothetical protein
MLAAILRVAFGAWMEYDDETHLTVDGSTIAAQPGVISCASEPLPEGFVYLAPARYRLLWRLRGCGGRYGCLL